MEKKTKSKSKLKSKQQQQQKQTQQLGNRTTTIIRIARVWGIYCWKFRSIPFFARGAYTDAVGHNFTLTYPIIVEDLLSAFVKKDFVPFSPPSGDDKGTSEKPQPLVRTMTITQYPIKFVWPSPRVAIVNVDGAITTEVLWRKPQERADKSDVVSEGDADFLGADLENIMDALGGACFEGDGDDDGHDVFQEFADLSDDDDDAVEVPAAPARRVARRIDMPHHAPNAPYDNVPEEVRARVVARVQEEAAAGHGRISEIMRQARDHSTHPIIDLGISLVDFEGAIYFVRWSNAADRRGHPVRLDVDNGIMMTVAFRHEAVPITGCDIIISNVPARMIRAPRPHLRTPMPAWCLQVRDHVASQSFSGPLVGTMTCIVCDSARFFDNPLSGIAKIDLYRCRRCGLCWHEFCAFNADEEICFEPFLCPPCCLA